MSENLTLYESKAAICEEKGRNYIIRNPFNESATKLIRGTDFAIIPGTTSPSLLKGGAEKIALLFGVMKHIELVNEIADYKEPFFYYAHKCELTKLGADGKEYVFSTGYGSCNTKEKGFGRADAFTSANSAMKKSEKRAYVDAVISMVGISNLFSQDLEDGNFNKQVENMTFDTSNPEDKITKPQAKRLFAIAKNYGKGNVELKAWLKEKYGLDSTNDITQKQYDSIVAELQKEV